MESDEGYSLIEWAKDVMYEGNDEAKRQFPAHRLSDLKDGVFLCDLCEKILGISIGPIWRVATSKACAQQNAWLILFALNEKLFADIAVRPEDIAAGKEDCIATLIAALQDVHEQLRASKALAGSLKRGSERVVSRKSLRYSTNNYVQRSSTTSKESIMAEIPQLESLGIDINVTQMENKGRLEALHKFRSVPPGPGPARSPPEDGDKTQAYLIYNPGKTCVMDFKPVNTPVIVGIDKEGTFEIVNNGGTLSSPQACISCFRYGANRTNIVYLLQDAGVGNTEVNGSKLNGANRVLFDGDKITFGPDTSPIYFASHFACPSPSWECDVEFFRNKESGAEWAPAHLCLIGSIGLLFAEVNDPVPAEIFDTKGATFEVDKPFLEENKGVEISIGKGSLKVLLRVPSSELAETIVKVFEVSATLD